MTATSLYRINGSRPSVASRRKAISLAAGAILAAMLLYYSLRGIDWRDVGRIISGASPTRLAAAVAIATSTLLLRACRWRVLLNAEGDVDIPTAFWATTAGYFGNNFLPGRAGELVRTWMISSRTGLEATYVLATALSERVADAALLVVIVAVLMLTSPQQQPSWLVSAVRPLAILGVIGAVAIAVLPLLDSVAARALGYVPMPHALRPRVTAAAEHGLRGMRAFHDPRRLSAFFGLGVLIWSLDALGTIVIGAALGLEIPVAAAFLLLAALGLGSALPATPGYVGIYQFVAVTVLSPFGFSRSSALAYILVAQALGYLVIAFWGAIGTWQNRRGRRSTGRV